MNRRHFILILGLSLVVGCDSLTYTTQELPPLTAEIPSQFDPRLSGNISGRVSWQGEIPTIPRVQIPMFTLTHIEPHPVDNPNAPHIDANSRALSSVIVMLRGVDPKRSRAWDLPAVGVELSDTAIEVRQGDQPPGRVGFVRAGAAVRFETRAEKIVGIRGRGADAFAFVFPPAGTPVLRTIRREGRIDLATASGQYWAAAELYVAAHPYLTRPDAKGNFTLTDVPEGEYELVFIHPNWHVGVRERDPETGGIMRRGYQPPVEKSRKIQLKAGQSLVVDMAWSTGDFAVGH